MIRAPKQLAPCPPTPNCVCSQSDSDDQKVDPFPCQGSCKAAMGHLRRLIESTPGATVVAASPGYLHAEYRSTILRFVDDLELLVDADRQCIQVRSASRVGSWDLGVNRRRVETLRRRLAGIRQ